MSNNSTVWICCWNVLLAGCMYTVVKPVIFLYCNLNWASYSTFLNLAGMDCSPIHCKCTVIHASKTTKAEICDCDAWREWMHYAWEKYKWWVYRWYLTLQNGALMQTFGFELKSRNEWSYTTVLWIYRSEFTNVTLFLIEDPEAEEMDVDSLLESLKQKIDGTKTIPTCISSKVYHAIQMCKFLNLVNKL